ncbi:hypothetical protein ACTU3I_00275 [Microbacterium sp. RD1]|uniref:hypothetical protein n=1 Tax=Microbacterium sp. RD1 TaxID=3457313 RepID=UPI003FA572B0
METTVTQIDVNLALDDAGSVVCRHCGTRVGSAAEPFSGALRRESPAQKAGPGVRVDPSVFTDRPIVLRQAFCPGCLTALLTEVVPADEPSHRGWRMS